MQDLTHLEKSNFTRQRIKAFVKNTMSHPFLTQAHRKFRIILSFLSKKVSKFIEERKYLNRPRHLVLEPTNICNANCIFCAYQYDKRPKKIANFDNVKDVVRDYVASGGKSITLTPFAGEIFINSDVLNWIKDLSSFKEIKRISTYSNASLLHTVEMKELMHSGLTELHISVSPLEEELYLKIYRSGFYSKVVENIRELLICFSNEKSKKLQKIEISFRADRTLDECKKLPDYKKYIAPYLSDGVIVTAMSSYDSWSGMIKSEDLLPGMELLRTDLSGKMSPCSRIYNTQILVDGSIRLCGCRFDNGAEEDELHIGNISEVNLIDAYNSEKARKIRNSFKSGDLLKICQKCSWYDL